MTTRTGTYTIRGGVAGRERLRVLSRVIGPLTADLLARVRVPAGARCLDAGCGGGDVTLLLAALAGADGAVLGIDVDEVKLALARDEAQAAGVGTVEYRLGAVEDVPPDGTFDVAVARFLLSHLPDPAAGLEHLAAAVRPGGVVAVQDIDYTGGFCHPPCAAFDYAWDLYPRTVHHAGGDARVGQRLPAMFAVTGFEDIEVAIEQPAGFGADPKLLHASTLENIAEAAIASGLADPAEIATAVRELHAFAARPDTMLTLPRIISVSGRVPAAG
jgi:ubiquinone/menaquinone biosynthesis C-methylase UbiE